MLQLYRMHLACCVQFWLPVMPSSGKECRRFKRLIYAVEFKRGRTPTIFQVRQTFTYTTYNLIYCIHCSSCGLLYIGKTKRRLDDCFPEHLRSIRPNLPDLPVAEH